MVYARLREQDLGFFKLVMVFKLLNNRHCEFTESSEQIMYKLSYNMSTEKFQAIQQIFLCYKYQHMQDCSKIVTPESWHPALGGNILSTSECGLFWALVLHNDDQLSLRAEKKKIWPACTLPSWIVIAMHFSLQLNYFCISFRDLPLLYDIIRGLA